MDINKPGIVEIDETSPSLHLTTDEIEALADELVDYHAEFADLYYRTEQAHWGLKYLQGLLLPIERKAIQPMAMALEGGNIQAMQQYPSGRAEVHGQPRSDCFLANPNPCV